MKLWLASLIIPTLLFGPGGSCTGTSSKKPTGQKAAPASVVVIGLHGPLTETGNDGRIFSSSLGLRKVLRLLHRAQTSQLVDKIVLRVGRLQTGWAQLAELRQAVTRVRAAGKRVIVHLDDAGNREYYLACSADEVVMSEAGSLWLVGVSAQALFLRGLLQKLGVEAELLHEGKYKGAADALTRKSMSPAMKEALGSLLDDTYSSLVNAVVKGRKMSRAKVERAMASAPLAPEKLVALGLIDRISNHERDTKRLAAGGSINWSYGKKRHGAFRSLLDLLSPKSKTAAPSAPHVALVYAEGQIYYGPGKKGLSVAPHVASHRLVRTLDRLRTSDAVKAVVLRINSPGGSALASDLLWHAVRRLASSKPVVVSMGDVAASGGYYMASPATRIYAQPLTITGSIGVVGGKFNLVGLMEKLDVTSQTLTRGPNADLFNLTRRWRPKERELVQSYMHRTYKQFIARVAKGRKMTPAQVEKVAQGRIWSGRAALAHRLVDRLGGLQDALADARRLGQLDPTAKTAVYPRPKTLLERLQEGLGGGGVRATQALVAQLVPAPFRREILGLLTGLSSWQRERALTWMPLVLDLR